MQRESAARGKKAEPIEAVPPPSPGVPAVSDDAIRLDEEIRLLGEQLARNLQLQNAQEDAGAVRTLNVSLSLTFNRANVPWLGAFWIPAIDAIAHPHIRTTNPKGKRQCRRLSASI
ncbi:MULTISPECIES: hypothetical protein [Rhizobium/Agrobacterium group]|uniref:hypothetical protein n=1 Tax=Rhizobium/Agrobacterium group TaxID=227290 RepID=UPI0035ABA94D